jgi:hypothetical protein
MEFKYKHKSAHIRDLSPLVIRLQPLEQYQSPWKYFPSLKQSYLQEDYSFVVKKRKIKLQLPSVKNNLENLIDQRQPSFFKNKVFPKKIAKFRSLSPIKMKS